MAKKPSAPMGVVRNTQAQTSIGAVAGIAQGLKEGIAQGEQVRQFEYNFDEKAKMDRLAIKARMIEIAEGLRNAGQDRQVNARLNVRGQNLNEALTEFTAVDDKRKQDSAQDHQNLLNKRDNATQERESQRRYTLGLSAAYQAAQPKNADEATDRTLGVLATYGAEWSQLSDTDKRSAATELAQRNSGGPAVWRDLPIELQKQELYKAAAALSTVRARAKIAPPTEGAGASSPVTNPNGFGIGPFGANMIPAGMPGSLSGPAVPAWLQQLGGDAPPAAGFEQTPNNKGVTLFFRPDAQSPNSMGEFDVLGIYDAGDVPRAVLASQLQMIMDRGAQEAALLMSAGQQASQEVRNKRATSLAAEAQGVLNHAPIDAAERGAALAIVQGSLEVSFGGYERNEVGIWSPTASNTDPLATAKAAAMTAMERGETTSIQQVKPVVRRTARDPGFGDAPAGAPAPTSTPTVPRPD